MSAKFGPITNRYGRVHLSCMALAVVLVVFQLPLATPLGAPLYSSGTLGIENLPDSNSLIEEGKQPATFGIELKEQLVGDATGPWMWTAYHGSLRPQSLIFSPISDLGFVTEDWSKVQAFTSSEVGYTGVIDEMSMMIPDNDTPELQLGQTTGSGVVREEEETTVVYAARLARTPSDAPVKVTVTLLNVSDAELQQWELSGELEFTEDNWNEWQEMSVKRKNDNAFQGSKQYTIRFSAVDNNGDAYYDDFYLIVQDDEAPRPKVDKTSTDLAEGHHSEFTVSLANAPRGSDAEVEIFLTKSANDPGIKEFKPESLTFDKDNWKTGKTVTVFAKDDDNVGDPTVYSLAIITPSDGGGASAHDVFLHPVYVHEDDNRKIIAPDEVKVPEDGRGTFDVRLSAFPEGTVTIDISATVPEGGDKDLLTYPSSISFVQEGTRAWNTLQSLKLITGSDDNTVDEVWTLTFTGEMGGYKNITKEVKVTIEDKDKPKPSVSLSADPTKVTEGFTVNMIAELTEALTKDVIIPLKYDKGTAEIDTNPRDYVELDFITISSGETKGEKTIKTNQDADYDDETFTVSLDPDDSQWPSEVDAGVSNEVDITIEDDDLPTVTLDIFPSHDQQAFEGETLDFSIRLMAKPGRTVTINLEQNNNRGNRFPGPLTITPNSLTFTPSESGEGAYNVSQKVKVTVADDNAVHARSSQYVKLEPVKARINGIDELRIDVLDDDLPKLEVDLSSPMEIDEGDTKMFDVWLLEAPIGDNIKVTIFALPVRGPPRSRKTDLKLDKTSLTFTQTGETKWDKRQTVTMMAMEDDDFVDDKLVLSFGMVDSDNSNLTHNREVRVTIKDNDTAAITAPTTVTVTEGETQTFDVSLLAAPSGDVTVTLSDDGASDLSWSGTTLSGDDLTFTTANWKKAQKVTLTAVEDDDDFANDHEMLTLTASGGGYDGKTAKITVTILDNDTAGIIVDPTSVSVTEGKSEKIKVKLEAVPSDDVTIAITGHIGTDLTPNPISLTFTDTDWDDAQEVTLTAAEDDDFTNDSVSLTLMTSGGGYSVSEIVEVTIIDDDAAGLAVPSSVVVIEGESEDIEVKLDAMPSGDVTIAITGHAGTDLTLDKPNLTFTTENWDTEQTVILTAGEDKDFVNDSVLLKLAASGGGYTDVTETVQVTITDDDAAGLAVPSAVTVPEGGSKDINVVLSAAPSGNVNIAITGHAGTDLTPDKPNLTFTTENWNEAQTVTLMAGEDDDFANDRVDLKLAASGGGYSVSEIVEATITDDDAAGLIVPSAVAVTEGRSEDIEVKLDAMPSGVVTIAITGHAGTDLTLDKSNLTFTAMDWNEAQKVTLTAAEDDDFENNRVDLNLAASGGGYTDVTETVQVTITDNDAAGLTVPNSAVVIEGESEDINVVLSAVPSGDVTIAITGHADTDLTLNKARLIFTTTNWDDAQEVKLTADEDDDFTNESVSLTLTTSGGGYDNVNEIVEVTIIDDDAAGLAVPSSVVVIEGESEDIEVKLEAMPSGDVTIAITGHAGTDLTLDKSNLTFTTTDWDEVQKVTLTADEDDDFENNRVDLNLAASGGDYADVTETVQVTIEDNDTPPTSVYVTLSAFPPSVEEGGSVELTATLSAPLSDALTVYLGNTPGRPPTEPGDYVPLDWITIPGGSRSGSGRIYIDDDKISEEEERFTVAINGSRLPSEVELGNPSSVEITILDDDLPPPVEVSLSVSSNSVDEGESITVTARLTGVLEEDVVVPLVYNHDETNQPPETGDYIPLSNITIFRGETEGSGEIQTLRDADAEDEIFIVALGDLPSDLLEAGRELSQRITIRDIPSPEVMVNLSAAPNPVDEGESVMVTVTLSEVHDTEVMIPLMVEDGTAGTQDYQASPPVQITINAGETRGDYSISTVADKIAEVDETFTVGLGLLPSGLAKGEQSLVKVTITDDDEAGIATPPSVSVVEGGTQTFQIRLTSKPLSEVTVMMTLPTGSLLTYSPPHLTFSPADWDMAKSVTLTAAEDDTDFSPNFETLTVTANGGGYEEIAYIPVTITDNDAPGIDVRDRVTVPEGGSEELKIALARSPSGPVVVTITRNTNPDLMLDRFSLTFTTADWQTPKTVTLTATEDDDFETDSGILLLTASGGGYDELIPITITVTIAENDAAGLVVEEAVTMEEGGTHPLEVRLLAQPSGPVTVTFSGHAGTDLSLSDTPLTFTTSNWNQAQTVTLTAAEDEDYETDTIELNLAASGGGYNGEDAPVTVTITDNDERPGPLTITIYDKRELEDAGAIQLPIELSRPTDVVVTVQYASTDGTAESGLDYTASRGIVIFDPGATQGVIEIEITDDEIPESTETFAVTLLKPQNAIIARGTGTGTILDNDGGTAILRVEDALVQEEEGMVRFQVSLSHPQRQMISAAYRTQDGTAKAGEDYEAASGVVTLAPGTLDAMIAVPLLKDGLDWQEETFTVHLESSENAEIAKAVGVATIQAATTVSQEALEAYTARFVRTSATQVVEALGDRFRGADGTACGAATRAEMARLWYSASSWDPSLGELLGGCRMSATSYSGSFSVWGRGAFRQFNGREDDGLTLDGEVTTGMLGADYRWKGGWLAGVLLSHSQGEGSFAAAQESGEITAGLTGVYPYVSVARAGWEVWLSAGAGRGQAEVLELDGDLTSRFGAMGVRGTLVSSNTIGLNYHGDVLVTDAEIEEHEVTAEVYRVRAGVEANARINNVLRPYVEANVRSDGGSAETGVGLEFGGGMRIAYPAWRLKADVHAQGLVMHTAEGFSEWGISGFVQVGNRSEGLMMRVRPSWGLGQGMSLYGQQTIRDAAPMGANAHRTELELGYGIPWKAGTARSIMGVTQLSQGRMYRLGGELHPWERLTFSVFGLAHGRAASLGDIGVNVRGSLRY